MLVVSTTHDRPPRIKQASRWLATRRRGPHLRRNPAQWSSKEIPAIDAYAAAYLIDLKLPPPNSTCGPACMFFNSCHPRRYGAGMILFALLLATAGAAVLVPWPSNLWGPRPQRL